MAVTMYTEPTTPAWQDVANIDVVLDLGYFINFFVDAIEVSQFDAPGQNSFFTYYGCAKGNMVSGFSAIVKAKVVPTSPAGGQWSATLNNVHELHIEPGFNPVTICVLGTQVAAQLLIHDKPQQDVSVAEVTLKFVPKMQ